ncbi:PREDICTED: lysophospholipid acyltransferase 1 [Nanorana parkeri]|uniref:lysophospholipid acyltransferase 1 n=1 Tax=Nanorana parkeri TaxID=125878 RepID=UPI000854BF57|nr:PREDICTED: lysophospholipid acyltransferase 1 [Nanorana parkeri]
MAADKFSRPTGSSLLLPVSDLLHMPLEQVNFVACQLFALGVAVWFRTYLSASHAHATVRHAFTTIIGIYLTVFCFGWYSLHIFTLVLVCYFIMMNASPEKVQRYSFITALSYLTLCQINRVYIFNYGILTTDFSGPLMIVTQKITTLAFQLHDGMSHNAESLTKQQLQNRVKKRPTLLEYLSYHLNFMSVLAGPCSNYMDYIAFVEGSHIPSKLKEVGLKEKRYVPDPSPNKAVLHKISICVISLILFLTISKAFPIAYIVDDTFINESSFMTRLGYLYIATMACKPKYYFAWTLADAVNNAAGYGFSGVDEKGNPKWDLINSLNIWKIEMATSFKMYIDNWNIQTAAWLKSVSYDRAPKYRTALTFLLSALWHGVYPGYYFTFITGIPVMLVARAVRINFRHYFITSKVRKLGYDIITWIVTQLAISYTCAPFFLLAVEPTMKLYKSFYFYFHIVVIFLLIVLPNKPSKDRRHYNCEKTPLSKTNHMEEKEPFEHMNNNSR